MFVSSLYNGSCIYLNVYNLEFCNCENKIHETSRRHEYKAEQKRFKELTYKDQWYEPRDVRVKVKSSKGNPGSTDLISDRLCDMV